MLRRMVLLRCGCVNYIVAARSRALDPEPKQPYLWRVVLFRETAPSSRRISASNSSVDIVAALQTELGSLGTAESHRPR